jgi:5-methylcytosine-specific restriction endonuclease McrA
MPERTCAIDGCDKPTRSGAAEWCKMHYHRWYRHGSPHKMANAASAPRVQGSETKYKIKDMPGHPVAGACGKVYVHRLVLFDAIGPGPHRCHWCNRLVDWSQPSDPDRLEVDHLNALKDDNRLANLVPSCGECNTNRGAQRRAELLRQAGWWSNNDTIARSVGRIGSAS